MSQMHAFQKKIAIPDDRTIRRVSSSIDDHLFPNRIIISYFQNRILPFKFKILRGGSDNSSLVHGIIRPHSGSA